MINKIKNILSNIFSNNRNDPNAVLMGQMLNSFNQNKSNINHIGEIGFKVFSQFDEDGIVSWLIDALSIESKFFIEFGVEDYVEANTRFLMLSRYWEGLIIDNSITNINSINRSDYPWKYGLKTVCSHVTSENINDIFLENNAVRECGLLSIDISGDDYWVWKNINSIDPEIVIIEFNPLFGFKDSIIVPEGQSNKTTDVIGNYWGCSLKALIELSEKKGYFFIGTYSGGHNAFCIKNKYVNFLKKKIKKFNSLKSNFNDTKLRSGKLIFQSKLDRTQALIGKSFYINGVLTVLNDKNLNLDNNFE